MEIKEEDVVRTYTVPVQYATSWDSWNPARVEDTVLCAEFIEEGIYCIHSNAVRVKFAYTEIATLRTNLGDFKKESNILTGYFYPDAEVCDHETIKNEPGEKHFGSYTKDDIIIRSRADERGDRHFFIFNENDTITKKGASCWEVVFRHPNAANKPEIYNR